MFRLLLENGADPDAPDDRGKSVRYYVQGHKHKSMLEILSEVNTAKDQGNFPREGLTPGRSFLGRGVYVKDVISRNTHET